MEISHKEEKVYDFNIFVGSEIGFLKGINFNPKSIVTKNFSRGNLKENNLQIVSTCWNNQINEEEIVVGFQNQTVGIFDTTCNYYTSSRSFKSGEGPLVSVFKLPGVTVTGLKSGEVSIWHQNSSSTIKTITGNEYSDKYKKPPSLLCLKNCPIDSNQLATGGCENDLAVWDINSINKPVFKAKNVKHDNLELRVPIWISSLTYMPNSSQIALCTRHKHIRLYDPQTQRRPVISFEWGNSALSTITAVPNRENNIIVGSGEGTMALFDLRRGNQNKPLHIFKNLIGGITDIVAHPTLPLVFSVSLDRFLRIHHIHKREALHKHYLKSRANCVLVRKSLNEYDFCLNGREESLELNKEFEDKIELLPQEIDGETTTRRKKRKRE